MSGDPMIQQLSDLRVRGTRRRRVRAQALRLAAEEPTVVDRVNDLGVHFTASAVVMDPATGRVLLMWHRHYDMWLQLGGHCDGERDLAGVALREAGEESGIAGLEVCPVPIDIDLHVCRSSREPRRNLDVRFLVGAPAGASRTDTRSPEGHPLCWRDPAKVAEPHLRHLLTSAQALLQENPQPRGLLAGGWHGPESLALAAT